jgi:hypothetical protein
MASHSHLGIFLVAALLFTGALFTGCAGSGHVASVTEIGRSYLPFERTIPSPDSLVHLTLEDRNDSVMVHSRHSFEEIQQTWSVARERPHLQGLQVSNEPTFIDLWDPDNYHNRQPRTRSRRAAPAWPESFATLWSRELALAEAAHGAETSATDPLQRRIPNEVVARELDKARRALRFDVYLFARRNTNALRLDASQTHVLLKDGQGRTYRPDSLYIGPPIETTLTPEGTPLFYRRNTVYVDRAALGSRLEDVRQLRLWVIRTERLDLAYTWRVDSSLPISVR